MGQTEIYIKANRNTLVKSEDVFFHDVASVTGTDQCILNHIKAMKVYKFKKPKEKKEKKQKREQVVISILKVIEQIKTEYPDVTIINEGEKELIITFEQQHKRHALTLIVKTVFVGFLCFFGTGFTIMAFHNDIGITGVFENIYTLVTGQKTGPYRILELAYSLGLAGGIVVFFNHFGTRRLTQDLTPIEVEMEKYENDINTSFVEINEREGKTIDVE
ncbi:MAG: stage V sporulation protein AA [Clostridia bacterium]|nr:stage V sporulation protein AA [Clostridia bacterium]